MIYGKEAPTIRAFSFVVVVVARGISPAATPRVMRMFYLSLFGHREATSVLIIGECPLNCH